jgi:hypothetical protein
VYIILLDAGVPRVSVLGPVALRVDLNNADKLLLGVANSLDQRVSTLPPWRMIGANGFITFI